jgi:hypothetical protein
MAPVLTCENQLKNWFSGLAEQTFEVEYGIADPPLIDYLSDMLVRFIRLDAVFSVRDEVGRRLDQVVDMLREAECREAEPRREVHRHIGDFTLFWTGVYPERLLQLKQFDRPDCWVNYSETGKRCYLLASESPDDAHREEAQVLQRLSTLYDTCREGLYQVRKEWDARPPQRRAA